MAPRDPQPLEDEEAGQVRAVLAAFAIPWRANAIPALLGGGYLNRNYAIRHGRRRLVLRRYDYNREREVIAYEHRLLQALPARLHQAANPRPIPTSEGDTIVALGGRHYALFPFIAGAAFDPANPRLLSEAGRTLAAYHNAVQTYRPAPCQRLGHGTVARLDWLARHAAGLHGLWQAVAALPVRDRREQAVYDGLAFLAEEAALLRATLTAGAYAALPQLVTHNDVGPQNVLCRGNRIVGLLDFDLATWDARVYDLAVALMEFGEDPALAPPPDQVPRADRAWTLSLARMQAVYQGYVGAVDQPLSATEIALLPWFLRAFGLWCAVWYLDLRIAGQEWYPEETASLIVWLRWLRAHAAVLAAGIVGR